MKRIALPGQMGKCKRNDDNLNREDNGYENDKDNE